jgi:DNA replication protein DnaC
MLHQPTLDKLQALKLTGMLRAYQEQEALSESQALSFEERLGLLVDRELTERDNRRLATRLRFARLRQEACLEDIDFRAPRGLDKSLLLSLADGRWIAHHDNCLLIGPTGAGNYGKRGIMLSGGRSSPGAGATPPQEDMAPA